MGSHYGALHGFMVESWGLATGCHSHEHSYPLVTHLINFGLSLGAPPFQGRAIAVLTLGWVKFPFNDLLFMVFI